MKAQDHVRETDAGNDVESGQMSVIGLLVMLISHWRWLVLVPLIAGAVGVGASYLMPTLYTSMTTLLVPQPTTSAAALLGSLTGGLSSLGGGTSGIKNPSDQWVALLKSRTVSDALVQRFDLKARYRAEFQFQARDQLSSATRIVAGRDGLISIEVDDVDPQMARDLAAAYAEELQRLSTKLAVGEASQRRVFFEQQLADARQKLLAAEEALQKQGLSPRLLKLRPESAVAGLAAVESQIASAQVRLDVLRQTMTPQSPIVLRAQAELTALKAQRDQLATSQTGSVESDLTKGPSYPSLYREFKQQEALYEVLMRQYEIARSDEARDGAFVQVVDAAQIPEWKSSPRRLRMGFMAAVSSWFLLVIFLIVRDNIRRDQKDPEVAAEWARLRAVFGAKAV